MNRPNLRLLWGQLIGDVAAEAPENTEVYQAIDFRNRMRDEGFAKFIRRYQNVEVITADLGIMPSPFFAILTALCVGRSRRIVRSQRGEDLRIAYWHLLKFGWELVIGLLMHRRYVAKFSSVAESLGKEQRAPATLELTASPVYLRTDMLLGLTSGGSVGHIAGVLNHLG